MGRSNFLRRLTGLLLLRVKLHPDGRKNSTRVEFIQICIIREIHEYVNCIGMAAESPMGEEQFGSLARTDSADEGYLDAPSQLCCVCKGNVNGRLICITRIMTARNYNVTFRQGIR